MAGNASDGETAEASGVVQHVDVAGRALTLVVNGTSKVFYVAPPCAVSLRGERVKLRLVLPRDHAHVVYTRTPDGLRAHAVEVNGGPDSFGREPQASAARVRSTASSRPHSPEARG
jgi:hypothetical protein